MASCRRRKSEADDAGRDVISEQPAEVKDRILECLPTRDAAKTALLSTHWNDAWLQHGRLEFDFNFFSGVQKCNSGKIITYILLQRVRPVKKFSLVINPLRLLDPKLEQSDLDQWFLFLSRNGVEELYISHGHIQYKLPFCIFSYPTIKQLTLCSLYFDFPINAPFIFPCVTSLGFSNVVFNGNGIVYNIPNLEKLDLSNCGGINNFKINAPKLESLSISDTYVVESRWFALHLKAIKVLCMEGILLLYWEDVEVASFPTATNLQVIKLDCLDFANEKLLKGVLHLLQKSPNLCQLDIEAASIITLDEDFEDDVIEDDGIEVASRLLKDPDSCIINQDLKLLKTIKIECFGGSTAEMLFMKVLLLKSPILERVFISKSYDVKDASNVLKIQRELLCFPSCISESTNFLHGQILCVRTSWVNHDVSFSGIYYGESH